MVYNIILFFTYSVFSTYTYFRTGTGTGTGTGNGTGTGTGTGTTTRLVAARPKSMVIVHHIPGFFFVKLIF